MQTNLKNTPNIQGKSVVFIDARYFKFLLQQQGFRQRINFRTFAELICNESELFRAYFFDCVTPTSQRLFEAVGRLPGFVCRAGSLKQMPEGGMVQKGVDVQLALDMAETATTCPAVNNIILVSGDADFEPAARFAQRHGKKVFVVGSERTGQQACISRKLEATCDGLIRVDTDLLLKAGLYDRAAPLPVQTKQLELPVPTSTLNDGERGEVNAGEIVVVNHGASAACKKDGIVIAKPGARIHALKGATVYLFHGVELTGTQGYTLIPCVVGSGRVILPEVAA